MLFYFNITKPMENFNCIQHIIWFIKPYDIDFFSKFIFFGCGKGCRYLFWILTENCLQKGGK